MTFILGIVIFIDDYLNALTVGETMKRVTDKFKVSREMLAYVVDSTAAPVCVLVPLSTWAVFLVDYWWITVWQPKVKALQFICKLFLTCFMLG